MKISFSVAVHAYNSEPYIAETLQAILGQSHPPEEVIVVNDGSTDSTALVARTMGSRVRVIDIENVGCGAARKAAIEACSRQWIATCDSDDVWMPDHLERRAQLIERFPAVNFTFSDCGAFGPAAMSNYSRLGEAPAGWLVRSTGERSGDYVLFDQPYCAFLRFNPAFASGWAVQKDAYRMVGGIDSRYSRLKSEDTEFSRRFMLHPQAVVAGDLRITWSYRRHSSNLSVTQWKNVMGKADILDAHLREGVVPSYLRNVVEAELLRTRIAGANMAYWEGDTDAALAIFRKIPLRTLGAKQMTRAALSFLRSRFRLR